MTSLATLIQPTGEMRTMIKLGFKEDMNTRDRDLDAIREWLRKQPHLPDDWDTPRLMTFLRVCNFSLEKCKKKLDMYFTMRAACPEFFSNRDITRPELHDIMTKGQGPPLPGITPKGHRVIIIRGLDRSLDTQHMIDGLKVIMMIGDIRLKEESEGVGGDVYVLDARVVLPSHLGKVSLTTVKKFLICAQEAYPVKLKEIHVVNASIVIDTIMSLVRPFLKEKIKNRIFIHTDYKSLYDHIPQEMLPEEYGGGCGSLVEINKAWHKKLIEYGPWFKEQESVKANEALRPGKPKNYDELFGIEGSFRQLSID